MTTTAAAMVGEANAQIEHVSPKQAADDVALRQGNAPRCREPVEWEQHIKGAVQVPRVCSSSSPIPPARGTTPNSTRPAG